MPIERGGFARFQSYIRKDRERGHAYEGPGSSHDDSERLTADQEATLVENFTPLLGQADKIVAVSDNHDMLAELEITVAQTLGDDATVIRSHPHYLDITAAAANKGDGAATLARAMGVSFEDVAVIADQGNDLAMFASAGLSVAMGQAPEHVRAAAGLNDEDRGLSPDIEVDGGQGAKTVRAVREAGADVIVAGSAIFSHTDYAAAIRALRGGEIYADMAVPKKVVK